MPGKAFSMPGPAWAPNTPFFLPRFDAAIAVGDADADALLPAEDRANVDRRAGLDDLIARIAGEKFSALDLEDLGNDFGAVHGFALFVALKLRTGRRHGTQPRGWAAAWP